MTADPLPLAQALIRCASVAPADAGAQAVLAAALEGLGFAVTRLRFGAIENLFARLKPFRSVATRYDKTARNCAAMVAIGCLLIRLKLQDGSLRPMAADERDLWDTAS